MARVSVGSLKSETGKLAMGDKEMAIKFNQYFTSASPWTQQAFQIFSLD